LSRIKILLICHFSNSSVRRRLILNKKKQYQDFAAWITNRVIAYENSDKIELTIVAPHRGMIQKSQNFQIRGIQYCFYRTGGRVSTNIVKAISLMAQKTQSLYIGKIVDFFRTLVLDIFYIPQKILVYDLAKNIEPDLIHLNGAENPYYSVTVLKLKKLNIPICVTIQGVVSNRKHVGSSYNDSYRIMLEKKILQSFDYYISGIAFYETLKALNPSAKYFFFPGIRAININPNDESVEKQYDFVFFARVEKSKGIEHLLEAISKLKNQYPDVSLLVMGPISRKYANFLNELCIDLDIEKNISIRGSIPLREDLFRKALKAHVYVLPTLFEGLATSAVEAMLLGLPVVTYATGGMPFLNKDGKNVLMSETGDIEGLISNMERLLVDTEFAEKLAKRGQDFARRVFSEEANLELNLRQYRAIIDHYHNGTPIPADLIYEGDIS